VCAHESVKLLLIKISFVRKRRQNILKAAVDYLYAPIDQNTGHLYKFYCLQLVDRSIFLQENLNIS